MVQQWKSLLDKDSKKTANPFIIKAFAEKNN